MIKAIKNFLFASLVNLTLLAIAVGLTTYFLGDTAGAVALIGLPILYVIGAFSDRKKSNSSRKSKNQEVEEDYLKRDDDYDPEVWNQIHNAHMSLISKISVAGKERKDEPFVSLEEGLFAAKELQENYEEFHISFGNNDWGADRIWFWLDEIRLLTKLERYEDAFRKSQELLHKGTPLSPANRLKPFSAEFHDVHFHVYCAIYQINIAEEDWYSAVSTGVLFHYHGLESSRNKPKKGETDVRARSYVSDTPIKLANQVFGKAFEALERPKANKKEARELLWQHHESMPKLRKASERQRQALEINKQLQEILSRES